MWWQVEEGEEEEEEEKKGGMGNQSSQEWVSFFSSQTLITKGEITTRKLPVL